MRYCRFLLKNDPSGAEDCAHDVFLLLLKKQKELNLNGNIRGWLYASADRIVKDYRKKQISLQAMLNYDLSQIEEKSFYEDELISSAAFDCLDDSELQLIKEYYTVKKGERIPLAKRYGMTVNELYKKVHSIREKLRVHLKNTEGQKKRNDSEHEPLTEK